MQEIPPYILEKIRNNDPELTEWDARPHKLSDRGVAVLVQAMQNNTHLRRLTLRGGKIPKEDYSDPTRISSRGAELLAQCPNLQELILDGNPIGDEGAIILSRSTTLSYLSVVGCAIGAAGANAFLENNSLHELRMQVNIFSRDSSFDLSAWGKALDRKLIENSGKQMQVDYWQLASAAIDEDDFDQFVKAINQLPQGVDTFETATNQETLLLYAVSQNKPRFVECLLNFGAKIENSSRQEYTPLFIAAEQGYFEVFLLLLMRGANLTGEFHFNQENCLSVCMFKFCDPLYQFLDAHDVSTSVDQRRRQLIARLAQEFQNNYQNVVDVRGARWQHFSYDLEASIAVMMKAIILVRQIKQASNISFTDIEKYLQIFKIMHDKYRVLRGEEITWKDNYLAVFNRQPQALRISVNLYPGYIAKPPNTNESLASSVERLNAELGRYSEQHVDWQTYPKFFIPQFRCVHYYTHYFPGYLRGEHICTNHLNRLAPASAIYAMSSLKPNQHQLLRESDAHHHRAELLGAWEGFRHSGRFEQGGRTYQDADAYMQQRATNYYQYYIDDVHQGKTAPASVLRNLRAIGYPHYATSDLPEHALRYGYGKKTVQSLSDKRLRANYSREGVPQNAVVGKIFVCLFTPLAMYQHRMRHVLGAHNRGRIDIRDTVVWERETSAIGGVESDYVFYEAPLIMPDLSNYDASYHEQFGLTKLDCERWLARFKHEPANRVESGLIDHLISHMNRCLMAIAQEEAQRQGGCLIYRHYDREYGLRPEPIRSNDYGNITPRWERDLFRDVEAKTSAKTQLYTKGVLQSLRKRRKIEGPEESGPQQQMMEFNFDPNRRALLALLAEQAHDDAIQINDTTHITPDEIRHSIDTGDEFYSADYVNLILNPLRHNTLSICVYPAMQSFDDVGATVANQDDRIAFVPINVPYNEQMAEVKNHWVAVIVDKQHQLVLLFDPARQNSPALIQQIQQHFGNYTLIMNPINFQTSEQDQNWVRHCGVYMIEIFKAYTRHCESGRCISGAELPSPNIPNSDSAQTVLSSIPCGLAEEAYLLRCEHMGVACHALTDVLDQAALKDISASF